MIPYQETFFKIMAAPFMGSFVCAVLQMLVFLRSKKERRKEVGKEWKERKETWKGGSEGREETDHLQIGIPSLQHAKFTHTEELLTSQRTQEDKKREESSLWCSKKIYFDPAHFSSSPLLCHHAPLQPFRSQHDLWNTAEILVPVSEPKYKDWTLSLPPRRMR